MQNIKWLIADFDRTLVQLFSDRDLDVMLNEIKSIYAAYGVEKSYLQDFNDPYEIWISTYKYLIEHFDPSYAEKVHQIASDVLTRAEMRAAAYAELLPEVRSTLQWLEKMQLNCAIVSTNSKEAIQIILENNQATKVIKKVFARDETIKMEHLKPSPTLIERAILELNASPIHTVFIGDSRDDMIAGKSAGVFVIGVLTGKTSAHELVTAGAQAILPSFSTLRELGHIFENSGNTETKPMENTGSILVKVRNKPY